MADADESGLDKVLAPAADAGAELEVIEAGSVTSVESRNVVAFDAGKHRAETSRVLALFAMCVLAGLIAVQYIAMTVLALYGKDDVAIKLAELFQGLLPVTSGLAISAFTYYFTRDK